MKKVVLITGCSSGIGLEAAKYFQKNGWQVVATMRNPEKRETELHKMQGVEILHLDVIDRISMDNTVKWTIEKFGQVDVLVNNAGYDLIGAFENMSMEQIERLLQTNVLGLMFMTKLVLPFMRARRSGTIINISSIGGRMTFPTYSIYHASKWAVEGFGDGLSYELEPFCIKVRTIEPGPINTNFYTSSFDVPAEKNTTDYDEFVQRVEKNSSQMGESGSPASVVAKTIFKAAISRSKRLRYPTGGNAQMYLFLNRILPRRLFVAIIKKTLLKK